ncbi:PLP-dependent aminotransferase family protein [Micromonospora aurantiaca]|uniref:MocR-like pyridoxine biosynthesis transcription factor PdxR n=1 Tax=Micromonospora aurantiaca (nom. illeg.) TaxID=47850 RepID=UPI0033BC4C9D
MDVHVSLAGPGDRATRIHRQLLEAILDGRLRPGERLPPTRELARRLDVSRNTVAVAYERLTAEGLLTARVGAGTFVAGEPVARARPRPAPAGGVRPRAFWASAEPAPTAAPRPGHDFRAGTPDTGLFPLATWRRLVAGELRTATIRGGYADPAGHRGLRTAVARYVGLARAVRAGPEDVVVTHGAQQALDLIARVILEPGDRVAVEDPGYPPARRLFAGHGARVVPVPVDDEGIDVRALPGDARLVYVTPSHQFPLGVRMSPARRAALLDWAATRDAVIVEDDYDTEFRFSARPLDPLQTLDRAGKVVYVGTFSKTLLPMLRLGFLVAPASLRPALLSARQLTDWHGDHTTQAALARFIDSGELARHIRKATRVYAERRDLIDAALRSDLAGWLDPVPSTAGLHLCARLRPEAGVDLPAVVARAAESGVTVREIADYQAGPPGPAGLVLGYGAVATADVPEGLRLLARSFRG